MERACNALNGLKPTILMVIAQMVFTGLNILFKLAAHDGMNLRIMVAYRFLFSAATMVPLAFFLESKLGDLLAVTPKLCSFPLDSAMNSWAFDEHFKQPICCDRMFLFLILEIVLTSLGKKRPKLTWTVILQAFLGGLFGGSLGQNLYLESLVLTSATCATAMFNLVPAFTFILAVCLRLENVGLKTQSGKAKMTGTMISIGGAMLFAFYKGPEVILWRTRINLLHHATTQPEGGHFMLGIILALIACLSNALWLIVQAKAAVSYPCPQSFTALVDLMGSIQSVLFALCIEQDWSQWKLGWNIRLLTVSYAGILGSGLMFIFIAICVRLRGPLFVSIFNPLLLILVAISGSVLLDEKLHLGNLLGAVLIIGGVYVVLWGKNKEIKKLNQLVPEHNHGDSGDLSLPLSLEKRQDGSSEEKDGTGDTLC